MNNDTHPKIVTERALFVRLKRALRTDGVPGKWLRKCTPNTRWHDTLGTYYSVDDRTGHVDSCHIDLEQWCREMKVIKPMEEIFEE